MSEESLNEIILKFGNRLRVRVCGICIRNNSILLIRHAHLGKLGYLWSPPGGGMEFGEDAQFTLKREFREETGLEIQIEKFLFVNEFLDPPLHGIELFFLVKIAGGNMAKGIDSEMSFQNQIIQEIEFREFELIRKESPEYYAHFLRYVSNIEEIQNLSGYSLNGEFLFN